MIIPLTSEQKRFALIGIVMLVGLYIFEPTSQVSWVKNIIEAKLSFATWVSVKNAFIVIFIYIWWKIFIAGR